MLSLKAKLTFMIIGLVMAAHFTTGFFIMRQVEEAMHHENHRRGMAVVLDLAHTSALSLISHDLAELRNYVRFSMQQEYVVHAMVIDRNCQIIMHDELKKVGSIYNEPCPLQGGFGDHYQDEHGVMLMDIRASIEVAGVRLGSAVISYSHAGVEKEIATLERKILVILLISICVAVVCAIMVGEYITRPIKHLSNVASKLGSGTFEIKKMDKVYKDELGDLTRSFYEMAGKLEKEVCYDALTGLYTRNVFQVRLAAQCSECLRHGQPLAVMMFDVDHFKTVNDSHGHLAGDKVLQEIATILATHVRGEDCVARYGGEEFIMLLPQTPKEGALHVAEKVRKRVEETAFGLEDGTELSLTISAGVALFPDDSKDLSALLAKADQALYMAKAQGRNRVCQAGQLGAGPA